MNKNVKVRLKLDSLIRVNPKNPAGRLATPGGRIVLITVVMATLILTLCPRTPAAQTLGSGRIVFTGHQDGSELNNSFLLLTPVSSQQKVESPSLQVRIQQFLARKIGLERLEKVEQELRPLVDSTALDLYLLYFWLKGQPLEGLVLARLQLRQRNDDPALLANAAAFLYILGEYQLAQQALESARNKAPDNPVVLNNLGVLHFALGQTEEARKFFIRATTLDNYQPEANRALYLLSLASQSRDGTSNYLKKSLLGAYRQSLAGDLPGLPLPQSFQQEIFLARPELPDDFESYRRLIPFYQTAFLKMEGKEVDLNQKLERLLAAGLNFPETETLISDGLALSSSRAYFHLNEIEGQLDFLEREIERPVDLELTQLLSRASSQLEAVFKDYQKREKDCLGLPRAERLDCIEKARSEYCQRYRQQAEYFYQRYKKIVLNYFQQSEPRLKNFVNSFYFWVRYLPEDQRLRKITEAELRVWRLYQRLWEKTFLMLTKISPPAFSDCLTALPLEPEKPAEPVITLYDPFSTLNLDYQDDWLTFRVRADRIIFSLRRPLAELSPPGTALMSTIHLYPPETSGARPLYLVLEAGGKLTDLGELGPWAFAGLSSTTSWKMLINLSLPEPSKN
ncbi:MAG: tetratricopeptide repeat protein [Candidatus Saccharicenans sp.]|nr:tetratricopeptide repeat protein [Candidatus Saccharicenans sp.]MDH7492335.1 tetratricopeptide repeat protein [Candidatus Saccharicenans sp.]